MHTVKLFAALLICCLIFSCGLLNKRAVKQTDKPYHTNPPVAELNKYAASSKFTLLIDGTPGTPIDGFFTPIGTQVLDRISLDGSPPMKFDSVIANKFFVHANKKGIAGTLKVTLLENGKKIMCDSTDADKGYVEMTAFPDTNEYFRSFNPDRIAGYIKVTCEKRMFPIIQMHKRYTSNFTTYTIESPTPLLIPVQNCTDFSFEIFNDINVLYDFNCEVFDDDNKLIDKIMCKSTQTGLTFNGYRFIRKKSDKPANEGNR
ncbi:MAG: hypothetical protein JST55_14695 [Bacteroidetes bacterium]|nr:hypothetical protein [Bacteroidota bacterium]